MTMRSETLTALIPALAKAQGAMGPLVKERKNPHFGSSYADLHAVIEACRAPLSGNDLAVCQTTDVDDGGNVVLVTTLMHKSGEFIASRYPIRPAKPDPQGYGSALTYARRYSLMALVGLAPEDDDGNAASHHDDRRHDDRRPQQSQPARNGNARQATRPDPAPEPAPPKWWETCEAEAKAAKVNPLVLSDHVLAKLCERGQAEKPTDASDRERTLVVSKFFKASEANRAEVMAIVRDYLGEAAANG